jgi:hypothetical protein
LGGHDGGLAGSIRETRIHVAMRYVKKNRSQICTFCTHILKEVVGVSYPVRTAVHSDNEIDKHIYVTGEGQSSTANAPKKALTGGYQLP